jgi:hypothetical protein
MEVPEPRVVCKRQQVDAAQLTGQLQRFDGSVPTAQCSIAAATRHLRRKGRENDRRAAE